MKTVAIVGLLPAQAQALACRIGSRARLRFVSASGDVARIPKADHCVLPIRFVRHLWTNQAFRQFPRERVHYVRGGPTDVLRTVEGIIGGLS